MLQAGAIARAIARAIAAPGCLQLFAVGVATSATAIEEAPGGVAVAHILRGEMGKMIKLDYMLHTIQQKAQWETKETRPSGRRTHHPTKGKEWDKGRQDPR